MNQSLALLYKDPSLAEELHDDIRKPNDWNPTLHQFSILSQRLDEFSFLCLLLVCFFNASPAEELIKAEKGDISEFMTTSFSETHTTEELLPARSEEEKDDEEEEERAFQNRPYPPHIGKYIHIHVHIYIYIYSEHVKMMN